MKVASEKTGGLDIENPHQWELDPAGMPVLVKDNPYRMWKKAGEATIILQAGVYYFADGKEVPVDELPDHIPPMVPEMGDEADEREAMHEEEVKQLTEERDGFRDSLEAMEAKLDRMSELVMAKMDAADEATEEVVEVEDVVPEETAIPAATSSSEPEEIE